MAKRLSWSTLAALALTAGAANPAPADALSLRRMVAFVQETCVECHGGDSTNAGVDFSNFQTELDVWKNRQVWTRAQFMIATAEMPPDADDSFTSEQRHAVANWIQFTLDNVDVQRIPRDPGFVPPRRLTGREYNYTVKDLFGLSQDKVYAFPADLVIGDSFDNDAATLTVEPLWFEKALAAADATVRAVWSDKQALDRLLVARPSPLPVQDRALYVATAEDSDLCGTGGSFSVVAQVKGRPRRIFLRSPRGVDDILGAKELTVERDAIVYRISKRAALRAEGLDIARDGTYRIGLTVRDGRAALFLNGRFLASRSELNRPDLDGHRLKLGTRPSRRARRRTSRLRPGQLESFQYFADGLSDEAMMTMTGDGADEGSPSPSFNWVAGMQTPHPQGFVTLDEAIDAVLRTFLVKAFRRAPTDEEMDRYQGLLKEGLSAGLTFDVALQHPVATALCSPAFLFRSEAWADTGGIYPVPGNELASRLSYFLWSSMPDEELRRAADRGDLENRQGLLQQADRLLAADKARRFIDSFVLQWLRTEGLGDTIRPNADQFPDVTASRLASMRQEGPVLFANVLRENRPIGDLLDASYGFLDGELAAHYGISRSHGPEWQEVSFENASRGGLLTQAAVLTVSSSPRRTSPVFRGKWVLEVLLGEPPPPPPPNVPALPAEAPEGGSLRELLAAHRSQPACAGCHSRIDPYGLALEQYDAVGRLRPQRQDTATVLASGESLDGVADLKRYLVAHKKGAFIEHLTRKMLAYALGRELQFADERAVRLILKRLAENKLGAKTLIHEVILSEPFRYRKNPTDNT